MVTENKSNFAKLEEYSKLLEQYLTDNIDARSFEHNYFSKFKNDSTNWSIDEFEILNSIFTDLDAFSPNPSLKDEFDIDEVQLRENTKRNLETLRVLMRTKENR